MPAIEFMADLSSEPVLNIPHDIAVMLPKAGRVRIIVVPENDDENKEWRLMSYEQFMRDDDPADAVYDVVSMLELGHQSCAPLEYSNAQLKEIASANPPPSEWCQSDEGQPF